MISVMGSCGAPPRPPGIPSAVSAQPSSGLVCFCLKQPILYTEISSSRGSWVLAQLGSRSREPVCLQVHICTPLSLPQPVTGREIQKPSSFPQDKVTLRCGLHLTTPLQDLKPSPVLDLRLAFGLVSASPNPYQFLLKTLAQTILIPDYQWKMNLQFIFIWPLGFCPNNRCKTS